MMTIPRRSILKSAGALSLIMLAPKLPLWAAGDSAPGSTAPTEYVNVAACLLGIDANTLVPTVIPDNLSLADLYYSLCVAAGGTEYVKVLDETYRQLVIEGWEDQDIAQKLLVTDGTTTGTLRTDSVGTYARLTMFMWLFGVWYGATEVSQNSAASLLIDSEYQKDFVVSSRAYKNGWIWRIAQAHPMGFSQFSPGSWANTPPSLADYGISLT
jgi:hypothetical protein